MEFEKEDENRLLVFEMMCLRKILGVSLLAKIRNSHIRQTLNLAHTIIDQINQKRMRFFRRIQWMLVGRYSFSWMQISMKKGPREDQPKHDIKKVANQPIQQ